MINLLLHYKPILPYSLFIVFAFLLGLVEFFLPRLDFTAALLQSGPNPVDAKGLLLLMKAPFIAA